MRMLLVAALIGAAPVVALGADAPMPVYDVAAICQGSVERQSCVESQYAARTMAAGIWLDVSPDARAECSSINDWHNYGVLWTCLNSHKKADALSR